MTNLTPLVKNPKEKEKDVEKDEVILKFANEDEENQSKNTVKDSSIESLEKHWSRVDVVSSELYDSQLHTPEQLHLSLGVNDTEVYVTWLTMEKTECTLTYARITRNHNLKHQRYVEARSTQTRTREQDIKWALVSNQPRRTIFTYRAKMQNLKPGKKYAYRVECTCPRSQGGLKYTSSLYKYEVREFSNAYKRFNIAFYGDMGLDNARSVPYLIRSVDYGNFDMVIHNGDFAYDLNMKNGLVGDQFMRLIEPIAARIPYQTSVGNHEAAQNFTHYNSRFTMIDQGTLNYGKQNNFYYSFNVGPVHFVAFSTEFYYFVDSVGEEALRSQYEWLKQDLAEASKPSTRAKRPWIIVFGHRPMYCSSNDKDDCTKESNILRKGLPRNQTYALEKLFYDFSVDVQLYSHEHQYERFLPIFNGQVYGGDNKDNPYDNPKAPVHIISGSAGCNELIDGFVSKPRTGSEVRIAEYGITKLTASKCKLEFEQILTHRNNIRGDSFIITKTRLTNFPQASKRELDCHEENDLMVESSGLYDFSIN